MKLHVLFVTIVWIFSVSAQSPGDENIRMSTPECNPSQDECNSTSTCQDVSPPSMTLTCQLIANNNLCDVPDVKSGNFCQKSCGTCAEDASECFTTVFGCQCKDNWEHQQQNFSGCANPDNDEYGSWCEIEPGSCTEVDQNSVHRVKFYDYCTQNCTAQKISSNNDCAAQCPTPLSPAQEVEYDPWTPIAINVGNNSAQSDTLAAPTEGTQLESYNYDVKFAALGSRVLVIVNFAEQEIDLTGWYLLDPYYSFRSTDDVISLQFGLQECEGILPTILKPGERLRLESRLSSDSNSDSNSDDNCMINPTIYSEYILFDDLGRATSQIEEFRVDELNTNCITDSGTYKVVPNAQCKWL